jgi:hypothetical protein
MTPARRYAIEREIAKQRSLAECWMRTGAMPQEAIDAAEARAVEMFSALDAPDPFGRPED